MFETMIERAMQEIEEAITTGNVNELYEILGEMNAEVENMSEFEAFKARAAIETGMRTIKALQKSYVRMQKSGGKISRLFLFILTIEQMFD